MATVLDLLTAPEFTDDRLTDSINVAPMMTGRLARLGLFRPRGIPTTYVRIAITDDEITIIPARERGGPPNENMKGDKTRALVEIPHFPLHDALTPGDLQNIMSWGESIQFKMVGDAYNEKLTNMRLKHDNTHHHMDWGAINGTILDAEGKTLLDVYDTFSLTRPTMNYALANAGTDVAAKNRVLKSTIATALRGAATTGVRIFAGPTWYDAYVSHAKVLAALRAYPMAGQPNPEREDISDVFPFAGVTVERVDEEFPFRQADNTFVMRRPIPVNEAVAVPMGTQFFSRFIAPPDTILDANRAPSFDSRIFVSTAELDHGKGRSIWTESNVLPICTRPGIMVQLTNT